MITNTQSPPCQTTVENSQDWLTSTLQVWGLALLTLHLAATILPEAWTWSLWPYTFLPPWLGWTLALLVAALIIPSASRAVTQTIQQVWQALPVRQAHRRWFAAIALLAGLLFWLARLRHLRWGDSYLLSVALSYPDLELRVIYNWQAPLTVFLHQRLWQFVADPLLGWPVENVYATTSIICGIIFVYLLLTFAAQLGRTALESAVIAGLVLTTGSMQLFFGYVENYTVISLGLLITLFLGWRALHGEISLLWPALGLSITNAFHPSTVFLWPGILLLSWRYCQRTNISAIRCIAQTALPPIIVGSSVLALMESGGHGLSALLGVDRPGGGDGIWFVPLFETTTKWQQYTMFSVAHIMDWLNIHLLISPFGLVIIGLMPLALDRLNRAIFDTPAQKDFTQFLGLTAAMYILLTWFWNPDYGGRKDWDLFAPSAFVYTLLAGYLLTRTVTNKKQLCYISLFVILVSLLHTGAWIFVNTQPLPEF